MVIPIVDRKMIETQELTGNKKEFRIGTNKIHLRIIGNGNKITMKQNEAQIDIIGNSNRLKIINNSGKVIYIGNSGKIYIGKESSSTKVHYTGNDGIFKLFNPDFLLTSMNSSKVPSSDEKNDRKQNHQKSCFKDDYAKTFIICDDASTNDLINIKNNISLPNLAILEKFNFNNCVKVGSSTGNIVINNSFNF